MSTWDIDPNGVRSVVVKTGQVAEGFEAEVKSYGGHMQSAATAAGTLSQGGKAPQVGLVGVALSQFAEATQDSLKLLVARTGKSLQGTVDATKAYLAGDEQMAADAQANALSAPDLSTPSSGGRRGRIPE